MAQYIHTAWGLRCSVQDKGKFEGLRCGTGNSEGSTLLVHETSVSACFPILTSGKGLKDSQIVKAMKVWSVRLKRTVSPNEGLVEGLTLSVTTQQNNHDYAELQKAVKANTNWRSTGGIWSDSWWDWI